MNIKTHLLVKYKNFDFEILEFVVYENKPYFVDVLILANLNFNTTDDFVNWSFKDYYKVSVPIFDLKNPTLLRENHTVKIKNINNFEKINLTSFNKTINDVNSLTFFEPKYNYAIGESFLDGVLNSKTAGVYGVLESWNFDYDETKGILYDNSRNQKQGKFFSSSILLLDFSNESFSNITKTFKNKNKRGNDISHRGNVDLLSSTKCISNECLNFNGTSFLEVEKEDFKIIDENLKELSFSFFIFPKSFDGKIFELVGNSNNKTTLSLSKDGNLVFEFGDENFLGNNYEKEFTSSKNISLNSWSYVGIVIDLEKENIEFYLNGEKETQKIFNFPNFMPITQNVSIGENFNGTLDELCVFSKTLTQDEISKLYYGQEIFDLNYVESLYGRGVYLNGVNNHLELSSNLADYNFENFSYELWFSNENSNLTQFLISSLNLANTEEKFSLVLKKHNLTSFVLENNFTDENGDKFSLTTTPFQNKKWIYVVGVFSQDDIKLFVNSKLQNITPKSLSSFKLEKNISLGTNRTNYFKGIIDEFRIYNYSLNALEIEEKFYNYNQKAKSCCSTITLTNPNLFGYNTTSYFEKNLSYSTKLFFNPNNYNISLFNVSSITSSVPDQNYYGFEIDTCLVDAFDIFSFAFSSKKVKTGVDLENCAKLVEMGFY